MPDPAAPPQRVLVVDDEPAIRELLAMVCAYEGWDVRTAEAGEPALRAVHEQPPDVVLLDMMLPDLDGLTVLRRIHASSPALPVIMGTALGESEMVVLDLELGANDYVTKPYDLPVLLARVQTQLSAKRAAEQKEQLERILAGRNEELERANRQLSETNQRMKANLQAAARIHAIDADLDTRYRAHITCVLLHLHEPVTAGHTELHRGKQAEQCDEARGKVPPGKIRRHRRRLQIIRRPPAPRNSTSAKPATADAWNDDSPAVIGVMSVPGATDAFTAQTQGTADGPVGASEGQGAGDDAGAGLAAITQPYP